MVLVNVLMLVAVAAAVLAIMVSGDDAAFQRATRMAQAAQAQQVARGGELSAVAALRRDMAVAPDADDATEPWAKINEAGARIEGGRFALKVADATGRLDLNALATQDPVVRGRLATVAGMLGLKAGTAERIAARMVAGGPIADLAELAAAGLGPDELGRLATVATVLPLRAPINLNAVPEPLLAVLLDDAEAARALVALRDRRGRLTRDDFAAARVAIPAGCGFASPFFWSVADGTVGDTRQRLTSLIERRRVDSGPAEVVVVARWHGPPPLQAPILAVKGATR